jgi:hypothetical protein
MLKGFLLLHIYGSTGSDQVLEIIVTNSNDRNGIWQRHIRANLFNMPH